MQIANGELPPSRSRNLSHNVPVVALAPTNIEALKAQDLVTDKHKDIARRFGLAIPSDLDLSNSGVWKTLDNGDRIWQLTLSSPGAVSLNINYDKFYMPEGSKFFVYNKEQTLGAFTATNNKADSSFYTAIMKGSSINLEYYEPKEVAGEGIIRIGSLVHGYRNFFDRSKFFGSSGGCNVNVVCDSVQWGDQIRAVVMILTAGNTRICTGTLINNVQQDGTPFVLSANHCPLASNGMVMFNYASPSCTPSEDGITSQTISNYSLLSSNANSDFSLIQLSMSPPSNYNVFYAGWSAEDIAPLNGTSIHHPSGDVKKIAHDTDPIIESGYYESGNNHWKVIDWNSGTTESGSSGCALFDHNKRIVGQLHGGDASCGSNNFDFFGKFSTSWDTDLDTLKQLKHWLDPENTGIKVLNGYDPNGSVYSNDAELLNILNIEKSVCDDSIQPTVTIKNKGNAPLTSLSVYYSLDADDFVLFGWEGNLSSYQTETITLPAMPLSGGNHSFVAYCSKPNAVTDQNLQNDTSAIVFKSNDAPYLTTLRVKTDNFGSETSWFITDSSGTIAANIEPGTYSDASGGETFIKNLCLYESCFTFTLVDNGGDGYCCSFGTGSMLLTDNTTGDTLAIDGAFNTDSLSFEFCLDDSCDLLISPTITHVSSSSVMDGAIDITVTGGSGDYTYSWSNDSTSASISGIGEGQYTVIVSDDNTGCQISATYLIEKILGIETSFLDNPISIYPNPSYGDITVLFSEIPKNPVKIELYNTLGQKKYSNVEKNVGSKINLQYKEKGIFLLSITSDKRSWIKKNNTELTSQLDLG